MTRNEKKYLIIILIIALLIRIIPFFLLNYPIESDAKQYNDIGFNLAKNFHYSRDGLNPTIVRPPAYPFFLALIYFIFGYHPKIAIFIQILLSSLSVYLIYLLSNFVFQKKLFSLITAGLATIYPLFIYYNLFLYSETFTIFTLLLFIYFLFKALKTNQKILFFFSGLFSIVFILTKPIFAPFLFFILLFLIFKKFSWKSICLFILPILILWGAWITRNYLVFSKPLPFGVGLGPPFFAGNYPPFKGLDPGAKKIQEVVLPAKNLNLFEYDQFLKQKAIEQIKKEPLEFIKLFFIKMGRFLTTVRDLGQSTIYKKGTESSLIKNFIFSFSFFIYKIFKIIISIGFLIGLFLFFSKKIILKDEKTTLFIFLSVYGLLAHSLIYVDERYHLTTFPFHIIIAIYAFSLIFYNRNFS